MSAARVSKSSTGYPRSAITDWINSSAELDGGGRAVHELRLNRLPLVRVALPRRARQRPDVELLAPLLACGELGLRGSLVVGRSDRPFVFRAEVTPQLLALSPPRDRPRRQRDHCHGSGRNQNPCPCWH